MAEFGYQESRKVMLMSRIRIPLLGAVLAVAALLPVGVIGVAPASAATAATCNKVAQGDWSNTCQVGDGDTSRLVLGVQQALNGWWVANQLAVSCGSLLNTDGDFGSATVADVECFQQHHGLTADGVVGPKTWAKLQAQLFQQAGQCNNQAWCYYSESGSPVDFRQWSPTLVWYVAAPSGNSSTYVQMTTGAPPS